jgi:hypothetical protein
MVWKPYTYIVRIIPMQVPRGSRFSGGSFLQSTGRLSEKGVE